jgi:hypothetical protein
VAAAHVAGTPLIADFMTQKNDIFARLTCRKTSGSFIAPSPREST